MSPVHQPPEVEVLRRLGERIATARRHQGWSQTKLAQQLGVGLRTVRRMEAGAPGTAIGHIALALAGFGRLHDLQQVLVEQTADAGESQGDASPGVPSAEHETVGARTTPPLPPPPPPPPPPMMRTTLKLTIGDQNLSVGTLDILRHGDQVASEFQYDDAWLERPNAIAISPDLPMQADSVILSPASIDAAGVPNVLADTAPGPWARSVVQHAHQLMKGQHPGLAPLDEIQYLSAIHDANRLGSLRLKGTALPWWKSQPKPTNNIEKLAAGIEAAWALDKKKITNAHLAALMNQGCFLGGSRPKLTYVDDDGRLSLVKPPRPSDTYSVPSAEVLALHLARLAGINAVQATIWTFSRMPVAVIRRFDRTPEGKRLHYISAATLLQAKANDPRGYLELLQVMARFCSNFQDDARELWRRLVFQTLIGHADDHLRSTGFLYSRSTGWRLAPSCGLSPSPVRAYRSQTPLSETLGPITSITMLLAHAHHFELHQAHAKAELSRTASVLKQWSQRTRVSLTASDEKHLRAAFEHERLQEALSLSA